jgi:hypothetical protein
MIAKYLLALVLVVVLAMPAVAQFNSSGEGGRGNSYDQYGTGNDSYDGNDSGNYRYSGSSGSSSSGTGLPLNMRPREFGRLIALFVMLVVAAFSWWIRQATGGVSRASRTAEANRRDSAAPTPVPMPRRHVALYSPTEIALATGRPLSEVPVNLPQGVHAVQHLKDKFRPKS